MKWDQFGQVGHGISTALAHLMAQSYTILHVRGNVSYKLPAYCQNLIHWFCKCSLFVYWKLLKGYFHYFGKQWNSILRHFIWVFTVCQDASRWHPTNLFKSVQSWSVIVTENFGFSWKNLFWNSIIYNMHLVEQKFISLCAFIFLTLCILMEFPIQINTIRMGLSIVYVYFKYKFPNNYVYFSPWRLYLNA